MVVYYIKKVSENLADYRFPIKEGDICMLYDGEVIKTIFIDSEINSDSIWRDYKFVDTKSLKSYQFPTLDSILCAPFGNRHAKGNTVLLTQLIKECKGEWLLDFLNETSAVLSGFVDYWDLGILRRFIGYDDIEIKYEDVDTLTAFLEKPSEHVKDDEHYIEEDVYDNDFSLLSHDIKRFCLSSLACIEGQINKRDYQILYETLNGISRSKIASRFHYTQEGIRQIIIKTTKQAQELLIEQRKYNENIKIENAQLKAQLFLLNEDIVALKALLPKETVNQIWNENKELSAGLALLLETPLADIKLPLRVVHTLERMGVEKFADIPQIESHKRVLTEKNSGVKSVYNLSRMLEDFNLTFGMSYSEIVNTLSVKDWHYAKNKWIEECANKESKIKVENNDNAIIDEFNVQEESNDVQEQEKIYIEDSNDSFDDLEIEYVKLDTHGNVVSEGSSYTDNISDQDNIADSSEATQWTKEEEKSLTYFYNQGWDVETIAKLFGRSDDEIKTRLEKLGLAFKRFFSS